MISSMEYPHFSYFREPLLTRRSPRSFHTTYSFRMKRMLKWLGILLGLVLLVAIGAGLYINYAPFPSHPVKAPALTVTPDSAMVAEGRRIASLLCMKCHMGEDGKLSGRHMADLPAEFG